jgi:hypothetical protein
LYSANVFGLGRLFATALFSDWPAFRAGLSLALLEDQKKTTFVAIQTMKPVTRIFSKNIDFLRIMLLTQAH